MKRIFKDLVLSISVVLEKLASLLDPQPVGLPVARVVAAGYHSYCLNQSRLQPGSCLERGLLS